MKNICLLVVLLLASISSMAQDDFRQGKYAEHGLNITPLLVQFAPFGGTEITTSIVAYQFQRIKNRRIFRTGVGFNLHSVDDDDFSDIHINLRMGFGKEHGLSPKWSFYKGLDFWFFAGNEKTPIGSVGNRFFNDTAAGIGLAPFVGLKFHISEKVNLGTETHFLFSYLMSHEELAFKVVPPVSLFLNVRFKR